MTSILADVRLGLRLLARSPLFTMVASLSLALGIGANTAIFSVANALVLTPLPVRDPARLVAIFTSDFSGPAHGSSSYPDLRDFARAPALDGLAATRFESVSLRLGTETERIFIELVNPAYFDVLGVTAARGRVFHGPDEPTAVQPADRTGIVISHRFWTRRLGAAPDAVGRAVLMNGQAMTVLGVAPASFPGLVKGLAFDAWVPMTAQAVLFPQSRMGESRGSRSFLAYGRLREGASLERAQAELTAIAASLQSQDPAAWTDVNNQRRRVTLMPESATRLPAQASGAVQAFLGLLLAIVTVVLLVACANVAGLLVGRATTRRREMAVRLALGAGRGRLIRQLLVESLLLAAIGGGLGLLVAQWTLGFLATLRPPIDVPLALDFRLDGRVLGFAAAVSMASGVVFGLAPALQSTRFSLMPALRNDIVALARDRRLAARDVLVVAQVALSLLLLLVGGLFLRGLQRAQDIDTGFDTRGVITATLDPSMLGYTAERTAQTYDAILARVRGLPGVEAAAIARAIPLSFNTGRRRMEIEGYEPRPGEDMEEPFNQVTDGYFRTMRMRIIRGRDFSEQDRAGGEPVVIVNEAFARKYWPGQDPLGKRMRLTGSDGPWARVVGLAADAKYFSLGEAPRAQQFLPFGQHRTNEATLHVRTGGPAGALAAPVRAAIRQVSPELPILSLATLEDQTSVGLLPQRIALRLLGSFGILALLMAAIGLYGVLAQAVAQRTREIGIRVALGATRHAVIRLIVSRGVRLTLIGIAIGLALAAATTRLLATFLFGISPLDPVAFAGGLVALVVSALLAAWVPARRAAAVDPVVALRYE